MRSLASLLLLLLAVLGGPSPAAADDSAAVRIGDAPVLELHAPLAGRTAAERATIANRVLAETLADPACDPEGFAVTQPEAGLVGIAICGRSVLAVSQADATAEGLEPAPLAERWAARLSAAWTAQKTRVYSRRLVEAAILGVLYPLLFLSLILVLRLGVRRLQRWVEKVGHGKGLRVGPVHLTAEESDRGLLSRGVGLLGWALYLFLTYVFLIAFFDRFPRTALWARQMLELLRDLGAATGAALIALVPRLLALLVLVVIARMVLRSVGLTFDQVRAGKLRLDPFLTPDTAGPAEITTRVVIVGAFVLLAGLLVPGEAGTALLAALGLAGLALAWGSAAMVENVLAGLVVLYGRPFRTGQAIRVGDTAGVVERKGFLHLRLRARDDRVVLVPNRRVVLEDVRVADGERSLRFEVVLRPLREECSTEGVFRHAAVEAGLRREDGRVELRELREGALVFRVAWPLASEARESEIRAAFLAALAGRSKGLGVEILSAREVVERS